MSETGSLDDIINALAFKSEERKSEAIKRQRQILDQYLKDNDHIVPPEHAYLADCWVEKMALAKAMSAAFDSLLIDLNYMALFAMTIERPKDEPAKIEAA